MKRVEEKEIERSKGADRAVRKEKEGTALRPLRFWVPAAG